MTPTPAGSAGQRDRALAQASAGLMDSLCTYFQLSTSGGRASSRAKTGCRIGVTREHLEMRPAVFQRADVLRQGTTVRQLRRLKKDGVVIVLWRGRTDRPNSTNPCCHGIGMWCWWMLRIPSWTAPRSSATCPQRRCTDWPVGRRSEVRCISAGQSAVVGDEPGPCTRTRHN